MIDAMNETKMDSARGSLAAARRYSVPTANELNSDVPDISASALRWTIVHSTGAIVDAIDHLADAVIKLGTPAPNLISDKPPFNLNTVRQLVAEVKTSVEVSSIRPTPEDTLDELVRQLETHYEPTLDINAVRSLAESVKRWTIVVPLKPTPAQAIDELVRLISELEGPTPWRNERDVDATPIPGEKLRAPR